MRNLKKLLALVLAMVMAFSLMLSAGAVDYKDYPDKDNITEEFKEAVQVLTGLKVFQGDEGGFRPGDTITRAEVAAIVYRIATGDVDGNQVKIYADYGNFTDVDRSEWYAGYVGFCANAEYIKGTTPTTFEPNAPVTGYQALAMILRVVGYDKNGEFTGPAWQTNVASLSKNLGITDNVKNANFETTLSYSGRRDVVADLLFQTAVRVPTVTYTAALGYSDRISISETRKNATLGQKTFGLFCEGEWKAVDKWGTPGYYWAKGGTHVIGSDTFNNNASTENSVYKYDSNWMPVYGATVITDTDNKGYNVVATITPEATKTYDTAGVHECDVAHDLDISTSDNFRLYVNRNTPITDKYLIVATDTVTRVGGQGRETKFWKGVKSDFTKQKTMPNWCTMVDTYLATVTNVTERVLDPAGHVITPAKLYLDVHDGHGVGTLKKTGGYNTTVLATAQNTSAHIASKKDANWEYAVGDKVLIKGYTDYTQSGQAGSGLQHSPAMGTTPADVTANNKAAFETNILMASNDTNDAKITVVQKAEFVTGKQSTTYWNTGKHTVDGKDYNDQMTLFLDEAGKTTNTTYAWYFDTKGNLIGIDNVPNTVNYGVITDIWTSFNQGETNTDGTAKTYAKVLYADGTDGTISIDRILANTNVANGDTFAHGTSGHDKTLGEKAAGLQMTNATHSIELAPIYDYNTTSGLTMSSTGRTPANPSGDAKDYGWLHVAPVASINASVDKNEAPYFGIIKGNLYKFVNSADGDMTVIEVSGGAAANTGLYAGHNSVKPSKTATDNKLYKNLGYATVHGAAGQANIWLDKDTRIMINDGTSSQKITCYTLDTLPGNVTIKAAAGDANVVEEIDWADTDNDGRAEYVYLTGTVDGSVTYGLFYYNGGAAQWSDVDKKGTLYGWLNGEPTTVNFNNWTEFRNVRDSQAYSAHLFALRMVNGVVEDVMVGKPTVGASNTIHLLYNNGGNTYPAAAGNAHGAILAADWEATKYIEHSTVSATKFGLGASNAANGNPYTANTAAIYYKDDNTNNLVYHTTGANVNTVELSGTFYHLTPNTKVIGLGMSVTQDSAILDYLNHSVTNDVTIVYENNTAKSIVEIYVATDPNVTPGTGVNPSGAVSGTSTLGGVNGVQAAGAPNLAGNVGNVVKSTDTVYADGNQAATNLGINGYGTPANLIYFPFMLTGDASAQLLIYDNNGNVVYSETGNFRFNGLDANNSAPTAGNGTTGGLHTFVLNVTTMINLSKGTTYSYTIKTVSPTGGWVPLSSGSFSFT